MVFAGSRPTLFGHAALLLPRQVGAGTQITLCCLPRRRCARQACFVPGTASTSLLGCRGAENLKGEGKAGGARDGTLAAAAMVVFVRQGRKGGIFLSIVSRLWGGKGRGVLR